MKRKIEKKKVNKKKSWYRQKIAESQLSAIF